MELNNVNDLEQIVRDKRSLTEMFATKFQEWYPNDKAFNTGFALLVLTGRKKLLKLSEKGAPTIPKVKDCPELDKENMFSLIRQHESLMNYIPDITKPGYISLGFYYSLLYHHKRDIYDYLYSVFVTKKKQNNESIKMSLHLNIPSDISQRILSYKSPFVVPKSKPYFQLYRYRSLFEQQDNVNDVNMNVNNVNLRNNENIIRNNSVNNVLINSNHSQIQSRVNVNSYDIGREQNYEFDSLLKSLFDYMVDENYHDCGQLIQTDNDRVYYLEKIIPRIRGLNNYDSFKLRNTDDQVQMVYNILVNVYQNEQEQ